MAHLKKFPQSVPQLLPSLALDKCEVTLTLTCDLWSLTCNRYILESYKCLCQIRRIAIKVFWRSCIHKNGAGSWQMDDPKTKRLWLRFSEAHKNNLRTDSSSKLHLHLSPYSLFFFIPLMHTPSFPQMLSWLFFNFSSICLSPSSIILFSPLDPLIPFTVCHTLYPPSPWCLHPSLSSLSSQEGQVHRLLSQNMWRELIGSSVWLFPPDCFCVAVTWLSLRLLFFSPLFFKPSLRFIHSYSSSCSLFLLLLPSFLTLRSLCVMAPL